MSGFVGLLNREGQPVDSGLLRRMTDSMAPQGPDAQDIWSGPRVGFGHALLRTTWESERERQPLGLDGTLRITGDIRLDGRDELAARLEASGCRFDRDAPDVDLVLYAYRVWEAACVERLNGDFAFAIWDARRQRLFCARDQFGVVPFYYAETKDALVLSNHINCVRLHPRVSDRLDERTIGDFLLFSVNHDFTTTTFADIRRLPPAHTLTWSDGRVRVRRYWQLPEAVPERRYRRREEYIERFRELFERAVTDRLRTDRAGTYLSGGMDTTSIAATAYRAMTATGSSVDFRAYTIIFKQFVADEEGAYAKKVAEHVGFPIEYHVADDYMRQAPEENPEYTYPEPLVFPNRVPEAEITRRAAGFSRVLLSGVGGDPALRVAWYHWIDLLRRGRFSHLARDTMEYVRTFHRLPGFGLRTQAKIWLRERRNPASFPDWFNPDYARKMGLRARQREIRALMAAPSMRSYRGMSDSPGWSHMFATSDPGFTGLPIKIRLPFFDVRLVSYLQSIPPIPWLKEKFLLREAMQGALPEAVRLRPKTVLRGTPGLDRLRRQGPQPWMERLALAPALAPYIDNERLLRRVRAVEELDTFNHGQTGPALVLAHWLTHQAREPFQPSLGTRSADDSSRAQAGKPVRFSPRPLATSA